jgi:SYP5 family syntaxin
VDLHTRLLDDLEEDVDVTRSRMRAVTQRVRQVIKRSSSWRMGVCIFTLIVTLTFVALVAFKIIRLVS